MWLVGGKRNERAFESRRGPDDVQDDEPQCNVPVWMEGQEGQE